MSKRALHSFLIALALSHLTGTAALSSTPVPSSATAPRATALLDIILDPATETNAWPLGHLPLYRQQPSTPLVWPPPPPVDPARAALGALDPATNEFEAPPLIVTKITALPAASGLSETQVVERFERNLMRERIQLADHIYRQGDVTNAITLLQDLTQYLRNPRNRVLNLNRLAAYEFRRQNYAAAANYMQQASELQNEDTVTKINLSAVLMTMGKLDEALNTLLDIYPASLDRLPLMFSVHFNLACVYSLKKDGDKALQNLAIAAQTDPVSTMASLGDPQLDYIRTESRFAELAKALDDFLKRNPRR